MNRRRKAITITAFAALLGLAVNVFALLPVGPTSQKAEAAEPPPATAGNATIGLFVAGNRISETQVAGVGGATFGFFANRPTTDQLDDATGIVSGVTPVATCTSTADGWCNVVIPIGAGGVSSGTRLWISPTALPDGWISPAYWQTAPLSPGTGTAARLRTQHVFQTPALTSGSRFVSGTTGWLSDPGVTVTDTAFMNANGGSTGSATTSNNFQRRTSSAGYWPLIESNPSLPEQCGVNIALVVDLSSSVQQAGELPHLKEALSSAVDSLRGTPSQLAIITFGTSSPANGFPGSNTQLMPVATTADANRIKDHFAGWNTIPTNYTNWDAGLEQVASLNETATSAAQHVDMAIVLTDGNPTVYGQNPTGASPSGFTRFRELENSTASANRVKAQGTRVVAVGVGDGLDETSSYNLRTISGTHKYVPGGPIRGSDFLQEASYAEAAAGLRSLVVSLCAPSISVVKQIIPAGGTIADAYTPAPGWDFTAGTRTPGATVNPTNPATQTTDIYTGATNFDVDVPAAGNPGTFDIAETPRSGYTPVPVSSDGTTPDPNGQNAYCTNKTEDDAPVPVTNTGTGSFSVDLVHDSAISCVVYNQAPDFSEASVVVHKQWSVTTSSGTHTYDEGDQPADLEATLRLGGPAPLGLSDQPWSEVREGYHGRDTTTTPETPGEDVDVAENVRILPAGCTFTSATISGTGISGDRDLGTEAPATTVEDIRAGLNEWTITNSVKCVSHLTLLKQVQGGEAPLDSWTLTAHHGDSALPGPSGTTGVSSEVTPDSIYQLSEKAGDDPELLNFVQLDQRSRPIQFPLSTGSVDCVQTSSRGRLQPGDPMGMEGAVSVPLGQSFSCTFTNVTAPLTVIKDVEGGTASASDFHFTVTPEQPAPEGLPSRSFAGAADPGHSTTVRPGQTYRISEAEGPAGYQLRSLRCDIDGVTSTTDTITIPAGSAATCTATNAFSRWTAEKSSDPASGQVTPGTVITYTITARHLEGHPTHNAVVIDDLSQVLPHATVVPDSVVASTGSAQISGAGLVWTIPVLNDVETLHFRVRVNDDAVGSTIINDLTVDAPGVELPPGTELPPGAPGPGDPGNDPPVICTQVPGEPDPPGPADCQETDQAVVAPTPVIPNTGSPSGLGPALVGGALLLVLGGIVTIRQWRRRD